jgi:hypothetical protein
VIGNIAGLRKEIRLIEDLDPVGRRLADSLHIFRFQGRRDEGDVV